MCESSLQRFAATLIAADLLPGRLIDLLPPTFPVASTQGTAIEVHEQKSQPIGARDVIVLVKARIQTREVLDFARSSQFLKPFDADQVDQPDGTLRHVEEILNVLGIGRGFARSSI